MQINFKYKNTYVQYNQENYRPNFIKMIILKCVIFAISIYIVIFNISSWIELYFFVKKYTFLKLYVFYKNKLYIILYIWMNFIQLIFQSFLIL